MIWKRGLEERYRFGSLGSYIEGKGKLLMEKDHLEMLLEDMTGKIELVLEGHEVLRNEIQDLGRKSEERFGMVDFKVDALAGKLDAVADDLAAHRRDTEAHKDGYRAGDE